MNRTTLGRLKRLEAAQPERFKHWRTIMLEEDEDEEPRKAAMIAAGEAAEDDNFIIIRLVSPPVREAA